MLIFSKNQKIFKVSRLKMLTWIFAAVLGSKKDLIVFHNSLNPEPALMMNILFRVCKNSSSIKVNKIDTILPRRNLWSQSINDM